MAKVDLDFRKNYYNLFWLFIAWFFVVFTILIGTIITVSFLTSSKELIFVMLGFLTFLAILGLIIRLLYKIKIYQDSERIIIYGRKFDGITYKQAFTSGLEIQYNNIRTIDLIPIKYFNRILSYQLCIKTKTPDQTYYIYSFSNLDKVFIRIRAFRFKKDKKNDSSESNHSTNKMYGKE